MFFLLILPPSGFLLTLPILKIASHWHSFTISRNSHDLTFYFSICRTRHVLLKPVSDSSQLLIYCLRLCLRLTRPDASVYGSVQLLLGPVWNENVATRFFGSPDPVARFFIEVTLAAEWCGALNLFVTAVGLKPRCFYIVREIGF